MHASLAKPFMLIDISSKLAVIVRVSIKKPT